MIHLLLPHKEGPELGTMRTGKAGIPVEHLAGISLELELSHPHQHGADLDENPGRGAGIQGHNTAVSTEHNLVDPVPDEESKVPGDLLSGILESRIS